MTVPESLLRGPVACVDLETTGGVAAHDRVIEVGIVLLDDGAVVEEWSSLVNPGRRIPRSIVEFTGIDDAMVDAAPGFADLRAEIRRRLDGRLFVAHNARFDYGFLRNEFRRLEDRLSAQVLCTVRLSRQLFPAQRRHNLDALIERHGLRCDARHRALGDARVLPGLLAAFAAELGERAVEEAVAVQLRAGSLPPGLPADLAEVLPDAAGVYVLRGECGVALRVRRARNLRSSVLAHFRPQGRGEVHAPADAVRDVDWFETGGELDAQLLEAKLRRQLGPMAGRGGPASATACVIRLRDTDAGTAIAIDPLDDDALGAEAEAYGPFRDELAAARALEGHARHVGLCLKLLGLEPAEGSCVAHQLGHCRGACLGKEPRALHDARLRLALAPQRLRPWPFPGAVAIRESLGWSGGAVVHLIDRWRHLGSARSDDELQALSGVRDVAALDADAYRIVNRWLDRVDPRDCQLMPPRGTGV